MADDERRCWWPDPTKKIVVVDTESYCNPNGRIIHFGYVTNTDTRPKMFVMDPEMPENTGRPPSHLLRDKYITQEEYDARQPFRKYARHIYDLLNNTFVIFHKKGGDINIIKGEFKRYNEEIMEHNRINPSNQRTPIPCPKMRAMCTHNMLISVKYKFGKNLAIVCKAFHIPPPTIEHNAGYDAEATYRLFVTIANRYDHLRHEHLSHLFPPQQTPCVYIQENWIEHALMHPIEKDFPVMGERGKKRKAREKEAETEEDQFPEHVVLPTLSPFQNLDSCDDEEDDIIYIGVEESEDDVDVIKSVVEQVDVVEKTKEVIHRSHFFSKSNYTKKKIVSKQEQEQKQEQKQEVFRGKKDRINHFMVKFRGTPRNLDTLAGIELAEKHFENMNFHPWGRIAFNQTTNIGVVFFCGDCIYTNDTRQLYPNTKKYMQCHGMETLSFRKTKCKIKSHGLGFNDCPLCNGDMCLSTNCSIPFSEWGKQFEIEAVKIEADLLHTFGSKGEGEHHGGPWKGLGGSLCGNEVLWSPTSSIFHPPDWAEAIKKGSTLKMKSKHVVHGHS
jgi:DNA polymerase III epsilon subunit-like protein